MFGLFILWVESYTFRAGVDVPTFLLTLPFLVTWDTWNLTHQLTKPATEQVHH